MATDHVNNVDAYKKIATASMKSANEHAVPLENDSIPHVLE
jgi:hypothetical protein